MTPEAEFLLSTLDRLATKFPDYFGTLELHEDRVRLRLWESDSTWDAATRELEAIAGEVLAFLGRDPSTRRAAATAGAQVMLEVLGCDWIQQRRCSVSAIGNAFEAIRLRVLKAATQEAKPERYPGLLIEMAKGGTRKQIAERYLNSPGVRNRPANEKPTLQQVEAHIAYLNRGKNRSRLDSPRVKHPG